jgi:hypothetical protein
MCSSHVFIPCRCWYYTTADVDCQLCTRHCSCARISVSAWCTGVLNMSRTQQYVYALFISTSHLFCLGYGLASIPGNFIELCVTLVSMTAGSILFLVVVGTLPTAVLEQEVSAAAHELEGGNVPLATARSASCSSLEPSFQACSSVVYLTPTSRHLSMPCQE